MSAKSLEIEAEKLQNLIIKLVEKHIPKKKLLEKAKLWWSKELKELRKEITKYKKKWKKYFNIQAQ